MNEEIEKMLKQLPKFKADALFRDRLQRVIIAQTNRSDKPHHKWIFALSSILTVLVVTIIGLSNISNQGVSNIAQNSQPVPDSASLESQKVGDTGSSSSLPQIVANPPNVELSTGFAFRLPDDWSAKVSDQGESHFAARFFLPGYKAETTYVDIESTPKRKEITNPWLVAASQSTKTVNGLSVTTTEGREKFQNSTRRISQAVFTNGQNTLVASYYRGGESPANNEFATLVSSVVKSGISTEEGYRLVARAYAGEGINGIDPEKFTKIEVMGEPMREKITPDDRPYQDGFAKLYVFTALKGQRLTTVAYEDRESNPGSFGRSELYFETGEKVGTGDTRIEYNAAATGKYYLIVHSFGLQSGEFLLKVFLFSYFKN